MRYLVAIEEYGSMSAASSVLAVSESAISQAIGKLEKELDVSLFVRDARPIHFTAAGVQVVASARRIVNRVDQLEGMSSTRKQEGSRLVFIVEPALAANPTGWMMCELRRRYPNLRIRLRSVEDSVDVGKNLREGVAQFAIVYSVRPHPDIATCTLGRHSLCVVFPPGAKVCDAEHIALRDLAGIRMVATRRGSDQREFVDDALAAAGVSTRLVVSTNNRAQLLPLVLRGVGATIIPDGRAFEAAARGAIIRRIIPDLGRSYQLVWVRDGVTPEMRTVIELAKENASGKEKRDWAVDNK